MLAARTATPTTSASPIAASPSATHQPQAWACGRTTPRKTGSMKG